MADVTDPNAAPLRQEVREDFPTVIVAICGFLGVTAVTLGIVLGLVLAND